MIELQSWTKLLRKLPFRALPAVNKLLSLFFKPPSPNSMLFCGSYELFPGNDTCEINLVMGRGWGGEISNSCGIHKGETVNKCFFSGLRKVSSTNFVHDCRSRTCDSGVGSSKRRPLHHCASTLQNLLIQGLGCNFMSF